MIEDLAEQSCVTLQVLLISADKTNDLRHSNKKKKTLTPATRR